MKHYESQHDKIWYNSSTFEATMVLRGVEASKIFAEGFELVKHIIEE